MSASGTVAAWNCLLLMRWNADGSPSPAPMLKGAPAPFLRAARRAGAASAKYTSLMATECVHRSRKRERSEETSWGVRLLESGIGMFSSDSSRTAGQVASSFLISSDLFLAKGIEASVNTTTPAVPRESAMTQSALAFATSSTLVVTLVKSRGLPLGPGESTACQPMSGMCSSSAFAT
ncbi:hypothetical protein GCM10020000_07980 [Streptomyces olivoverticillatus]